MRIRHIKPEFWEDEHLAEVSRDARLLFAGLWNMADAEGKVKATAKLIKGQLFRYDDDVSSTLVESWLAELSNHSKKFIVRYEVDGQSYIFVSKFLSHQRPDPREKSKGYPDPTLPNQEKQCSDNVLTVSEHTPNCMGTGYLVLGTGVMGSCNSDSPESNDEKKPSEEPQEFIELAKWFFDEIRKNNPGHKEPKFNSWAKDIRLIIQTDKRTPAELKELFTWVQKDGFWRSNCLSPGKLREKWDQLWMKMKSPPKQPFQVHSTALPGNQITPAHKRQSGLINLS